MYSFRQRSDTSVVDEPLYAHYLARSGVVHPGREDVLAAQSIDGESVVRDVIMADHPAPIRFFKHMGHHLRGLDKTFLSRCVNVILTRNPEDMLRSLIKQVPDPDLEGTGLPMQVEILDSVRSQGERPIVVESRALLERPRFVLAELCARIGVEFDCAMLSWPAGPKPEDGVWAPHWYDNVHASTRFDAYQAKPDPFPDELRPLLETAEPLYRRIAEYGIGL